MFFINYVDKKEQKIFDIWIAYSYKFCALPHFLEKMQCCIPPFKLPPFSQFLTKCLVLGKDVKIQVFYHYFPSLSKSRAFFPPSITALLNSFLFWLSFERTVSVTLQTLWRSCSVLDSSFRQQFNLYISFAQDSLS